MPGLDALVPVALGGDSLAGNAAAIAALGIVTMIAGYLALAGLWYFVFRRSPAEREAERRAEAARAEAVRTWRPASGPGADPDPPAEAPARGGGRVHVPPLRIERSSGSRFRRR